MNRCGPGKGALAVAAEDIKGDSCDQTVIGLQRDFGIGVSSAANDACPKNQH